MKHDKDLSMFYDAVMDPVKEKKKRLEEREMAAAAAAAEKKAQCKPEEDKEKK